MEGEKPLHQITTIIEPPKHLKTAVFLRISEESQKKLSRRKLFFRSCVFLSIVCLGISGFIFGKEIVTSDFWSIASLGFTDINTVAAHWQEFVLSLTETFPTEAIALVLSPIFILLVLAQQYYQDQNFMELKFK